MEDLTQFLVMGVPMVVVVPLVLQQFKDAFGLPTRFTGLASMGVALVIVLLTAATTQQFAVDQLASYVLSAMMYGVASNGVYSQAKLLLREDHEPTTPL